ncbi:MAG: heme lyase CcmF/NrfE family subunit [Armatimonadetes bacterium]|nr:heme lyase CcmF/NrfE family subunit [Armatimonadota bacterium]
MISFGNILLWFGLLTTLACLSGYMAYNRGNQEARGFARAAFGMSVLAILSASLLLFYAFVQHRFDIAYVAEYSSRDLPLIYCISAFWAGQEGSFLLWALMGAAIGLVLMRKTGDWEGPVMPVCAAVQAFLMLLLVVKSPFRMAETALADGQGLNPLLQDPWMAIHPPAIFLGYAALAVPFAFAVTALVRREYDRWVLRALPWTLFAWVTLGAGVFIGGYWAYRVLGWGGYWGWDPVENASLIPWLLGTALLHGMVLQRARGSLKRGNLLLAIGAFVMMLYGTFLTRSGVLGEFSVHSFVDPGKALYWTLLGGLVVAALGPVILLAVRAREVNSRPLADNLLSRDFAFFLGALVLCISAAIVTIGTSTPLVMSLLGKPTSVKPEFYNRTHLPIGVLLVFLVGVAPVLAWRQNILTPVIRRLRLHLLVAAVGAIVALLVGVRDGWMLLLITASVFALAVNAAILLRMAKRAPLSAGGYLTHVGLALMLIGIVGSSMYSCSQQLTLQPGQSAEALGYHVTYIGSERPEENRRELKLQLAKGGAQFFAAPKMVFSPQMNSWVHSPAVKHYWLQDIYVSPTALEEHEDQSSGQVEVSKGESVKAGGYTFTFERFDMSEHTDASSATVGAVLHVKRPDGKRVTVKPTATFTVARGLEAQPARVPDTNIKVAMVDIKVPSIQLAISGLPGAAAAGPREEAVVEVSNKPLIGLLWLGTVLVLVGGLVAGVRRAREISRADGQQPETATVSENGKRVADGGMQKAAGGRRKPVGSRR